MCKKTNYKSSNVRIDKCMRPLIEFLNDIDYDTIASCCGHGKYPMTIVVRDFNTKEIYELLSETEIPRKRSFYKKDKQNYYFIPEVIESE